MARSADTTEVTKDAVAEAADAEPTPEKAALGKRALIDRVAAETGLKRRQAKVATEALLAAMGDAVAAGDTLVLEPFGRLRVTRVNEGEGTRTLTCKLRRKTA